MGVGAGDALDRSGELGTTVIAVTIATATSAAATRATTLADHRERDRIGDRMAAMTSRGAEPSPSRWRSYREVDTTGASDVLSRQLDDIASVPAVAAEKRRSLDLLGVGPGGAVLDVGCGNGSELAGLAELVGPLGRVVGIDPSATLIGAAEARGLAALRPVELVIGEAESLPFEADQFDACRADRTLQHLAHAEAGLAEMARVARRRGRIVVTESRWGLVAPSLDRDVTGRILHGLATDAERASWLGSRLPSMLESAGLTDVRTVSADFTLDDYDELVRFTNVLWSAEAAVSAGRLRRQQADTWSAQLRELSARGDAFAMVLFVHVIGTKP
jgi:SAM-dependent methyltransferase